MGGDNLASEVREGDVLAARAEAPFGHVQR
jgi:hypothetical protein